MNDGVEVLIRFGEDSVREFKSIRVPGKRVVEPDSREIADDFAAAANAVGATFLFGVNDKTHEIEGVPVILSASGRLSGKCPEYKLLGESELLLTIHSVPIEDRKKLREMVISSGETINQANEAINNKGETISRSGETIKGCVETIVETIKLNPGISLVALSRILGKSRASIARIVSKLKRMGDIEYRGSKKTGGYFCKR